MPRPSRKRRGGKKRGRQHIKPPPRGPLTSADRRRLWRKRWMFWQRLPAFVLLVTAGPLCVAALATEASVNSDTASATAEVIAVDDFRKQPDTITVRFTTETERTVETDIEDDGPEVGDTVEVEYNRSKPSSARLKDSEGPFFTVLLYGATAIIGFVGLFFPQLGWFGKRS